MRRWGLATTWGSRRWSLREINWDGAGDQRAVRGNNSQLPLTAL